MRKQVATLEPIDYETLPHPSSPPAGPSAAARSSGRFQYGSGDNPLAGYTIKRGVGQGGFGEIYYAVSDAGKDVALKLIRRNLEIELRGIRQCLNLKHPHLLDLYDIRQDDHGDSWVVMEYVADRSLEDILAAQPDGLPLNECLAWIRGIGAGVAYLHDRGIVHRDLKPGNIFCDEGVVKVGDYGLSKFISCSRRSGHTESIGTVHYMAPEVANGRYGKEIDVYAMGVILYELLTGRVPFEGESIGEVLMKHLTARPDVSMLCEPCRSIVARAMEKDPSLRYGSAAEMLAALPSPVATAPEPSFCEATTPVSVHKELGEPSEAQPRSQGNGVIRKTVVAASVVREEPVLQAVRQQLQNFRRAAQDARRQTPGLYVLMVAGTLIAAVYLWPAVAVLAIVLGVVYGVYRLIWTLSGGSPSVAAAPPPVAAPSTPVVRPRRSFFRRREKPAAAILAKSPRERVAELLGSLLGSTLASAAMCVVMLLIESFRADTRNFPKPEQFVWLLLVSAAGAWAVLILSKFWEGRRGDAVLRRFMLMVVGMGVGAAAFVASEWLMVGLPPAAGYPQSPSFGLPLSFYGQDGHPMLLAYVACFGTLFLLVRWWQQADPLRAARLSMSRLLVCIVIAGAVAWAWQFPQPWLPMIAGIMSVSVQLASPWMTLSRRRQ